MKRCFLLFSGLAFLFVLAGCAIQPGPAKTADSPPTSNTAPPPSVSSTNRIKVAFLISPDAEVVDFSGPWGVFEYVSVPGYDDTPFELYTVAESATPVKVSGGMTIIPNFTLESAPQPEIIVVPAQGEPTKGMLDWIRRASVKAHLTMSVCNGAFLVARAGLLSGKQATAHHGALTLFEANFPDISVQRGARFVDSGSVATAGGLTSGIDLALHVVERYYGRAVAEKTATALEYQGKGWKDPRSNAAFAKRPVWTDEHPICPICEMDVNRTTAKREVFNGRTYYFCSDECKKLFDASPDRFATK
jgi:transcriptional regulator GlxA family with amidase domain/YHS domain-containing protein